MSDIEQLILAIRERLDQYELLLTSSSRTDLTPRDTAVLYCVERMSDLASGWLAVARDSLIQSQRVLDRALWETMVRLGWSVQSDENALQFESGSHQMFLKDMRKNLKEDMGAKTYALPGVEYNEEFVGHLDSITEKGKALPDWNEMADAAGLKEFHRLVYGGMSNHAHGTTFGMNFGPDSDEAKIMHYGAVNTVLTACHMVAADWLDNRVYSAKAVLDIIMP